MRRSWFVVIGLCLSSFAIKPAAPVGAQEFRVYSRIEGVADASGRTEVLSRSLTLWHAGKVYDYIDSAGEVTILEPAQRQFHILNSTKRLSTTADFDELKHQLEIAEERLVDQIHDMERGSRQSPELLNALRFQLQPKFQTTFDPRERRLALKSPLLTYDVHGQSGVNPQVVEAYCDYADWMCRLNYVLHPQPVFPKARLALNEQLRKRRLMPVDVHLTARLGQPLTLQAHHELSWTLSTDDRDRIQHWDSLRQDSRQQNVSLHEYQRALLSHTTARSGK